MPLFKRKKQPEATSFSLPTFSDEPRAARVVVVDTDWGYDANIRAEWNVQGSDLEQDLLGWRNGMRMSELDEVPGQRFNEAEYITRGLKHALSNQCPLNDAEQAESIRRILNLLDRVPGHIVDTMEEFMPRLARLALFIARERGWQPERLGGDGRVPIDPSSPIVLAALACSRAPDGRYVDYFFLRPNYS